MNIKTTIVLLVLVLGGGLFWLVYFLAQPTGSDSPTLAFLTTQLKADQLTAMEVRRGQRSLVLHRLANKEWTLPGKWPVREVEVAKLVSLLTSLQSRFAPIPLGEPPALSKYGLDRDYLSVRVTLGTEQFALALGEEPDEVNRFARATFLRLGDNQEVIRLGPGLIAMLDRPQEFFQQRRLFPSERMAKDSESTEKIERLLAEDIAVHDGQSWYKLTRTGDDWELLYQDQDRGPFGKAQKVLKAEPQPSKPIRDRIDPDKLQAVLRGVPDIWAEQFVDKKDRKLEDFGLDKPPQTLTVARGKESVVTLLIGKESQVKEREVSKPGPPSQFGPPKMITEKIIDEYRFAKLQGNDQVFEIKADRLKDVLVNGKMLRDAQLARFRSEDVRRLEIHHHGQQIVLEKDKDRWQLRQPRQQEAESSQVTELLDKLAGLRAGDKEIIDDGDAKVYGLDKPALVKIKVEETKGKEAAKTTRTSELTFRLGTKASDQGKVYVQLEGWPRINALEDAVLKLVQRPALAYRNRRVLDSSSVDLAKLEIQRQGDTFALEQLKGKWKLATPVQAEVDTAKIEQLASSLASLEAVEFVAEEAKPEELDKTYGLAKPALSAKITFSDAKKPARTLALGKQRPGKDEYFARLDASADVFVVRKATFEALNKDSLALRPLALWNLKAEDIAQLKIHKDDPEYVLKRADAGWTISGPFTAKVLGGQVLNMTEELAKLKAEKFVAHSSKDLGKYGLDKPYLRITVTPEAKKEDKETPKERVLLIGQSAGKDSKDSKARYARLGDGEAIFELGDKVLAAIDRNALDLLGRQLLSLDVKSIKRLRSSGTAKFTLQPLKDKEDWQVVDSPAPPFTADSDAVKSSLRAWSRLQADKVAAYGGKINWAAFGLDKPALVVTATVDTEDDKGKSKTVERTLALGQEVKDKPGQRYARLDKEEAVVVLGADLVSDLSRSYLDFVDTRALKYDLDTVNAIQRRLDKEELEIVKKGEVWHLSKPAANPADVQTIENILEKTFRLRVKKVAAYPAADLPKYGLDKPAAVVAIKLADPTGKTSEHTIKIGKPTPEKDSADRFALIDKGEAVVVLAADLAELLLAPALQFRDHNLASVRGVDKAVLERGPRKIVFARVDGAWKVTEPIAAEAEQTELDGFLQELSRLRARRLVADKPGDLKPFGLVKPQATWKLSAGNKEVLTLQVGGEDPQVKGKEPGLFARLGNSELIFLLSPKLGSQALAEYRHRKPWPSFDAAQVDKVMFGYPSNPFTLQKEDNTWQAAGKVDVKVDSKKVSDLLDALAGLQVLHYVEDHKPDLVLYGLQQPALKLDLTMGTDKRTLLIGRAEGDSKRFYATIPGEPQAIFVLSEADAQRIMRHLAAFVSKETKEKEKEK